MEYEWDPTKNRANVAKHGIDFADAVAAFEDDLALTRPDASSRGELRFVMLGCGRHPVIVYAERDPTTIAVDTFKIHASPIRTKVSTMEAMALACTSTKIDSPDS